MSHVDVHPSLETSSISSSQIVDQKYLAALSPAQVQAFALRRVDEYRTRIIELHNSMQELLRVHNAASPILSILPNEMIMQIFRFIHPNSREYIRIGHVCRAWRFLLHNTPEFWAELVSIPEATVRRESDWRCFLSLLTRSFPRPYGLTLEGCRLPLMSDARSHLARITSLVITFETRQVLNYLRDLSEFLALGLPHLEELAITIIEESWYGLPDPPDYAARYLTSHANFPRLRTLRTTASLFTAALACPSLRHVTLAGGRDIRSGASTFLAASSFAVVLETLRQCGPDLETLELVHCTPLGLHTYSSAYPPLYLGSLRTLSVDDSAAFVRAFLEHVSFPATTRLRLTSLSEDWRSAYGDVLPQSMPLEVTPLIDKTAVRLNSRQAECSLRAYVGGEERLSLDTAWVYCVQEAIVADLRELFAAMEWLGDVDLDLDDRFEPADAERWALLLAALPNVVRLTVRVPKAERLVEALSGENALGLVPYFEELEIHCWHDDENTEARLASVVQARVDAGCSSTSWTIDITGSPPPADDYVLF